MDLSKINKPTLLLDETKCRRNIRNMAEKASLSDVVFRPHFKTHQSTKIGCWFSDEGVSSITVSSATMAKHFADAGWKDITIAFPANSREVDAIGKLSESIDLNILISNLQQADFFSGRSKINAGYFIKIDTGNSRCGIEWNDHNEVARIINSISQNKSLRMKGFLTHSGHTYRCESKDEIIDIHNDTLVKLTSLKALFPEVTMLSTGDTPSCSVLETFKGVDEIRPGNFVFYDLMQYFLGSCDFDRIALAVACPVVEKNLKRKEIIIYGGGVHLSKEFVRCRNGKIIYGKAVLLNNKGWEPLSDNDYLRSLSQEHGIIESSDDLFRSVDVGDLIGVIPVHSCMTADLLRQYKTFDDKVIDDFSPK
jgi:D-serine deaminase-like pyridoxal phosphate-dependent protein